MGTTIRCRCGAEAVTASAFVSSAVDLGWMPIIGRDGAIHYVCPTCTPQLQAAARLIRDYSNEYASLGSLLKERG